MPTIDDDDRNELRLTLNVVPGWELSPTGWSTVRRSLVGVQNALERGDRVSFYRHLEEIDRAAPARLARLSPDADMTDGAPSSPPEPVLELVNALVHAPDPGSKGGAP